MKKCLKILCSSFTRTRLRLKEHLLDTLELAHRYMMTDMLFALTREEMLSKYIFTEFWKYLSFGTEISDVELGVRCLDVFEYYAKSFLSLTDFVNLSASGIGLIVSKSYLDINEFQLFEHLLTWSVAECQRRNPPLEVIPGN